MISKKTGEDVGVGNEIIIGDRLRQARLDKNISIDELQQKTKIQKRYLEAIESGNFAALPGAYYVRTFIRQYAEAVGEKGDVLVDIYDGKDGIDSESRRAQPETVQGSRKALHEEKSRNKTTREHLPVVLLGFIAFMIVGVIAYAAWQDRNSDPVISRTTSSLQVENSVSTEQNQDQSSEQDSAESTETTSSSEEDQMEVSMEDSTQSQATIQVTNAEDPLELEVTGKNDRAWVGVSVNGNYTLQETLQPGQTENTTIPEGTENFVVTLGASANVDVTVNDQEVDFDDPNYELLRKDLNFEVTYQD
ncbi:helix-turn-helix domain-containing protein [Tetragenococcus muriaticus]|uniref:helix-turn-helix domain-containing protein n=1 Tax=Tetragenococcus muriaticus TaxID=64642 RepID=UPI001E64528E|nr:RodZ domain-containing protein [Tetragenococcus muriaticus]